MKNSTKTLALLAVVLLSFSANAQRIGVKAGYSYSDPVMDIFFQDDAKGSISSVPGFHIGPYADFKLAKILSMEVGLQFESKGFDYEYYSFMDNIIVTDGEARVYYLTIPVAFKLGYNINSESRVYGIFGSYLSLGVGGTDRREVVEHGIQSSQSGKYWTGPEYFSDNSPIGIFQKLDLGFSVGAGYEINDLQFSFTYDIGMKDIAVIFNSIDVYNRVLKFSVGCSIPYK